MAELLLELLTEEIPARMQGVAAEELKGLAEIAFEEAGLKASRIATYVTPRRLTLVAEGLPAEQPGSVEERRGPRVGAPQNAIDGFLKSAGLSSLEQCEKRATDKGEFYFALLRRPGQATAAMLPRLLTEVIRSLPWPKSMRFPAADFRWVRPLTSVLCILDNKVLKLDLGAVPVGMETRGHRFLSKASFNVRHFADYQRELRSFNVILDAGERRSLIAEGLAKAARDAGLAVKEDDALLGEVTGLVEWPVVLLGRIEPEFMALPPEVLTTSMRTHQKYFACLDDKGDLAPRFMLVSNMVAEDGGKAIIAGNERVLRARLSDAKFFWDQDRKVRLESRVPKLAERVFYEGLGTTADKVERIRMLARYIAESVSEKLLADTRVQLPEIADRAALLAKADLTTSMVGEFPELQGLMGSYYALHDREPLSVAQAIREHYAPQGPGDRCPNAEVSICVALADKIDTLVGFFGIGEFPTGSKDPFALRRAALGAIRLILENKVRLSLLHVFSEAVTRYNNQRNVKLSAGGAVGRPLEGLRSTTAADLLAFFADRLKAHMRGEGFALLGEVKVSRLRHDLIAAVFAIHEDDLVRLLARGFELAAFLATEDGANLLVAYRRAANILRIEEKKDGKSYSELPERELLRQAEEVTLAARLADATARAKAALEKEDFAGAMAALAALRAPVDEFFNKVTVNVAGNAEGDRALRANRLRLLSQIRDTLNRVADFSKIEG